MSRKLLWMDGELVEAKPSLLRSLTPGVLKAKGVFETMRARDGEIVFLTRHLRRMSRGLGVLNFPKPVSFPAIRKNIRQLLKVNGLKNARVRLMVWRKAGRLHSAIICEPLQALTARQYSKGFTAMLTNGHRRRTAVPIKSLDYQIFRRSLQKARAAGFDEALLLNDKGELVEGSRANIFLVKDNVLSTPPVTSGCLPGVTRQAVIQCARKLRICYIAKPIEIQHLLEADEIFLTNALFGIIPLTYIQQRKVDTGKAGSVTIRLTRAYNMLIAVKTDKRRF